MGDPTLEEVREAVVGEIKHLLRTRPVRGFSDTFSATDLAEEMADAIAPWLLIPPSDKETP